jgi:hypothetical protein
MPRHAFTVVSPDAGADPRPSPKSPETDAGPDRAVREYIGSLSRELAGMARSDGDETLAGLLEAATLWAGTPGLRTGGV